MITKPIFHSCISKPLFLSAAIALTAIGSLGTPTHAAEEVGKSVRIKNVVNASINNRRLAKSDPVFTSENIQASANSHGEIRLNDNSKVIVGENSSISLDDFVTGGRGFSSGSIKVAKGAFRFITGNSPKGAFTVETPVSTIGVRGTVFDVYVKNGTTRVILFRGEVEVCSASNCVVTNNACDVVEVSNGQARELGYLRSGNRAQEAEEYDLTDRQNRFRLGWRAPTFRCEQRAALDGIRGGGRRAPIPLDNDGRPTETPDTPVTPEPDPYAGSY